MRLLLINLLLLPSLASAHYFYKYLLHNSVRYEPAGRYLRPHTGLSNLPINSTTHPDLTCNFGASTTGPQTDVLKVTPGTELGFWVHLDANDPYASVRDIHMGPVAFYLGRPPSGDVKTWNGSGRNWVKIYEVGPMIGDGYVTWFTPAFLNTVIPTHIPSGQYLLRAESISLERHYGNMVEIHVGCAQIEVVDGGSGDWEKAERVSIPGHLRADEEGLTVDISKSWFDSYVMPGPAVWRG